MRSKALALATTLSLAILLSGCLGDDSVDAETGPVDAPDQAPAPEVTEELGALSGTVLAADGEPIPGATIVLEQRGTALQDAIADKQAKFVFNQLAAGTYTVRATAQGFLEGSETVGIENATIKEIELRLKQDIPPEPARSVVEYGSFSGQIICGLGVSAAPTDFRPTANACNIVLADEAASSVWEVRPGARTLIVGLTFDEQSVPIGTRMQAQIEQGSCGASTCSFEYGRLIGESGVYMHINDEDIADEDKQWSNIENGNVVQARVFPASDGTPEVFVNHIFTFHWAVHSGAKAPPDATPFQV